LLKLLYFLKTQLMCGLIWKKYLLKLTEFVFLIFDLR
jgi:hypothetical protein